MNARQSVAFNYENKTAKTIFPTAVHPKCTLRQERFQSRRYRDGLKMPFCNILRTIRAFGDCQNHVKEPVHSLNYIFTWRSQTSWIRKGSVTGFEKPCSPEKPPRFVYGILTVEVHGLESFSGEGMVGMIFFHSHVSIYNVCFIYFTLYVGNFSFLSAVSFHCFLTDFDVNNFCTYYFCLIYK